MNQNRNAVFLLITLSALLVGSEYYFLLHVAPRDAAWYTRLLTLFMKGGWLFRLLFALMVPMLSAVPDETKAYREVRHHKRPALWMQFVAIAGYLLGAGLLAMAHRFPYQFTYIVPVGGGLSLLFGVAVGYWLLRSAPKSPMSEYATAN